jgi:ATP-binding protein involved in chromosome partitioning
MTGLVCSCGQLHNLFGEGGGRSLADQLDVPLLAQIALRDDMSEGGDTGQPVGLGEGEDGTFHVLARRIVNDVAPPVGAEGCSARLLDAINQAVDGAR